MAHKEAHRAARSAIAIPVCTTKGCGRRLYQEYDARIARLKALSQPVPDTIEITCPDCGQQTLVHTLPPHRE